MKIVSEWTWVKQQDQEYICCFRVADNCFCLHPNLSYLSVLQVTCLQKQQKLPWQLWRVDWRTSITWKLKRPGHLWRNNFYPEETTEAAGLILTETTRVFIVYIFFITELFAGCALCVRVCVCDQVSVLFLSIYIVLNPLFSHFLCLISFWLKRIACIRGREETK